jgi:hypothetical protein
MPGVAGHQSQVVLQRDCGLPHIVVADVLADVLEPTGDRAQTSARRGR